MAIEIPIDFIGKFDNAMKDFKSFSGKIGAELEGLSGSLGLITAAGGAIAGAFAAGKIISGLQDIIHEGAEAEKSMQRLVTSLKSSGDFSIQNVNAFKALADEISQTTKFTDDAVIEAAVLGKQYGLNNKQVESLIKASVQLASAQNEGLVESTRKLAQTYDGTAGKLATTVTGLQNLTAAQLKAGAAAKVVAETYKHFAEDELNTFSGQLEQAVKNFGEVKETIGTAIIQSEALKDVIKALNVVFINLRIYIDENSAAISNFVKNGIIFAANAFLLLVNVIREADRIISTLYLGFQTLYEVLSNVAFFIEENVIRQFKVLVKVMTGDFKGASKLISEAFSDIADHASVSLARTSKTIDDFGKRDKVYDDLSAAAANFSFNVETGNKYVAKTASEVRKVASAYDEQNNKLGEANRLAEAHKKAVEEEKKEYDKILGAIKEIEKATKTAGHTEIENVQNVYNERLKTLDLGLQKGVIGLEQYLDIEYKIRTESEQKIAKLRKEELENSLEAQRKADEERRRKFEEFKSRVQELISNPLKIFVNQDAFTERTKQQETQAKVNAAGAGFGQAILGGKDGAKKLLGQIGEAIAPGLGPIVEALTAGPDAVKKQVEEFAKALPDLIEALLEAVPVFITTIVEKIPEIIEALVDKAPDIIASIIAALPRLIGAIILFYPRIIAVLLSGALRFVGRIIGGAATFVGKILSGAAGFVGEILKGAGQFIEKLIQGIGNIGGDFLSSASTGFGLFGKAGGSDSPLQNPYGSGTPTAASSGGYIPRTPNTGGRIPTYPNLTVHTIIHGKTLATTIVDLQKQGFKLVPA